MNAKELGKEVICGGTQLFRTGGDGSPRNVPDGIIGGLTKRELFAAMAMQGILSAPISDYDNADPQVMEAYKGLDIGEFIADQAVQYADRLLARLAKDAP